MTKLYAGCRTVKDALELFTRYRDIAPRTVDSYRRVLSVFINWAGGGDPPLEAIDGEAVTQLLADKRRAGRSSHYLRSLRSSLVAFIREVRGDEFCRRVRSVRAKPLDPQGWTPGEVARLVAACDCLAESDRTPMKLLVQFGYFSGLDYADIERVEQDDILADGTVIFRRGKTGARVVFRIPRDLVNDIRLLCPHNGPCLKLNYTQEWIRRLFGQVVRHAGLTGSFKKLRKTSGSLVERERPGTGHRHLGHGRAIFERHYEAKRLTRNDPTMAPPIVADEEEPAVVEVDPAVEWL